MDNPVVVNEFGEFIGQVAQQRAGFGGAQRGRHRADHDPASGLGGARHGFGGRHVPGSAAARPRRALVLERLARLGRA